MERRKSLKRKTPVRSRRKTKQATWKRKCDKLFSIIIRSVGYCQNPACGERPPKVQLHCAHIYSRRYALTRCDFDNALCLCAGCHHFYTDRPLDFYSFIEDMFGKEFIDQLREKAHGGAKVDWEEMYESLREEADRRGIAA